MRPEHLPKPARPAEDAQQEISGVRPIPNGERDPFHDPERKHRLIIGATKRILKLLEQERKLLTDILVAEEESALAKKEWERDPSPSKAKKRDATFDKLERFERTYQEEFLPHEATSSGMRTLSWEKRLSRTQNNIEKQRSILQSATRALEKIRSSKTAPARESA
ncbi:hypothetical protein EDM68_02835 [Candidatus Uhrbacteria bacterium]|nr:MAG: hypothetical protein EDM68_02835 [Candidatus Uhrbacteria bacterium]